MLKIGTAGRSVPPVGQDNFKPMNESKEAVPSNAGPAPVKVLVVDDDTCIFDIFQEICPRPQFALTTAAHDSLALRLVKAQWFDVAFVDYFLGDAIGTEVARKLLAVQPELRVVLMSGFLVEDRAKAMESAGASAFLIKPFSIENAQSVIERLTRPQDARPRA